MATTLKPPNQLPSLALAPTEASQLRAFLSYTFHSRAWLVHSCSNPSVLGQELPDSQGPHFLLEKELPLDSPAPFYTDFAATDTPEVSWRSLHGPRPKQRPARRLKGH